MRTRAFSFGWSSWSLVLAAASLAAACSGAAAEDGAEGATNGLEEHDAPRDEEGGPAARSSPLLELLPSARLARIRAALPEVEDAALSAVLKSPATIWYDRTVIIPGYQDSFGDNVIAPIGFRPNTIDPQRIDLAVPGGHQKLFVKKGFFHFPFGVTGGADDAPNTFVVDFWAPPLDAQGKPLPVVWWRRDPNQYTHKYVWAFPKGTVFGEVLFITAPSGASYVYEIRTRTRELARWRVDAVRPFPRAVDLAAALEAGKATHPGWASSPGVAALEAHLAKRTLVPATLKATHFASAFPAQAGATDELPAIGDEALVVELLTKTPFRSARGVAWKEEGALRTWAPTTRESFSIVPKGYKAGFLEVSEASCERCHRDAGRPFKDWYPEVLAYGELWGEDETFSWHPFETSRFVGPDGAVKNFNYDNRAMRPDFVAAGLVAKYDPAKHPSSLYTEIPRAWRSFAY